MTANGWKKQYHLDKHGIKQQLLLFKLLNLTKPGYVFLVSKFDYRCFFSTKHFTAKLPLQTRKKVSKMMKNKKILQVKNSPDTFI